MTVTALMIFVLISQVLIAGYLLYSFNDAEREARKRTADLRAHIDRCITDLESRLRDATAPRSEPAPLIDEPSRKRALG
jgi:hypothetical protein